MSKFYVHKNKGADDKSQYFIPVMGWSPSRTVIHLGTEMDELLDVASFHILDMATLTFAWPMNFKENYYY